MNQIVFRTLALAIVASCTAFAQKGLRLENNRLLFQPGIGYLGPVLGEYSNERVTLSELSGGLALRADMTLRNPTPTPLGFLFLYQGTGPTSLMQSWGRPYKIDLSGLNDADQIIIYSKAEVRQPPIEGYSRIGCGVAPTPSTVGPTLDRGNPLVALFPDYTGRGRIELTGFGSTSDVGVQIQQVSVKKLREVQAGGVAGTAYAEYYFSFVNQPNSNRTHYAECSATMSVYVKPGCFVPPGSSAKMKSFGRSISNCSSLGSDSNVWEKEFADGSKLQLACNGAYVLSYVSPHGGKFPIGECAFYLGQNNFFYTVPEDAETRGEKDACVISTSWTNMDAGFNDGSPFFFASPESHETARRAAGAFVTDEEPYIDFLRWTFDANALKVSWVNEKYEYPSPQIPGLPEFVTPAYVWGILNEVQPVPNKGQHVDPPLGTALSMSMADYLETRNLSLPQYREPMQAYDACDLNADGACNQLDAAIFARSIGHCATATAPLKLGEQAMDYDSDGCVTLKDYQQWIQLSRRYK